MTVYLNLKLKSDVEKGLRHFHAYDNLPIDDKF